MKLVPVNPDEFVKPPRQKSRALLFIEEFLESGMPIARIADIEPYSGVDSCVGCISATAKRHGIKVKAFVCNGKAYIKRLED